jgi:hypothetical protein
VQRIVITGCAGSGKSTLARQLAARTGLPLTERDALGPLGSPEYLTALADLAVQPEWILDAAPYYTDELIYRAADTIVILDYRKPVVLWRVLRRTLRVELTRRPAGAHQPQGLAAFRDPRHPARRAWTSHAQRHREGLSLIDRPDLAGTRVLRLTRPAQARRWLRRMPRAARAGVTE